MPYIELKWYFDRVVSAVGFEIQNNQVLKRSLS